MISEEKEKRQSKNIKDIRKKTKERKKERKKENTKNQSRCGISRVKKTIENERNVKTKKKKNTEKANSLDKRWEEPKIIKWKNKKISNKIRFFHFDKAVRQ